MASPTESRSWRLELGKKGSFSLRIYVILKYHISSYITVSHMGVSQKLGTPPKSSMLIGFSIIFTIHFGVPPFLETPIYQIYRFSEPRYLLWSPFPGQMVLAGSRTELFFGTVEVKIFLGATYIQPPKINVEAKNWLGGGFKHFLFSPILGKMIHFD